MKNKVKGLVVLLLVAASFADEDLLRPIGIVELNEYVVIDVSGSQSKMKRDSLFPYIEKLELALDRKSTRLNSSH